MVNRHWAQQASVQMRTNMINYPPDHYNVVSPINRPQSAQGLQNTATKAAQAFARKGYKRGCGCCK